MGRRGRRRDGRWEAGATGLRGEGEGWGVMDDPNNIDPTTGLRGGEGWGIMVLLDTRLFQVLTSRIVLLKG